VQRLRGRQVGAGSLQLLGHPTAAAAAAALVVVVVVARLGHLEGGPLTASTRTEIGA
jgi:hypothetical protein